MEKFLLGLFEISSPTGRYYNSKAYKLGEKVRILLKTGRNRLLP